MDKAWEELKKEIKKHIKLINCMKLKKKSPFDGYLDALQNVLGIMREIESEVKADGKAVQGDADGESDAGR